MPSDPAMCLWTASDSLRANNRADEFANAPPEKGRLASDAQFSRDSASCVVGGREGSAGSALASRGDINDWR